MLRVATPPLVDDPGLLEALARVVPQRLEEPIARRSGVGAFDGQHRLRHEPGERVDHVEALDAVTTHDRGGIGPVEAAGEHPEPIEHEAFAHIEQRVGPVDGRPEGLVPFDGAAAPAGEEPKPLVEQLGDLRGAHGDGPGRRQFDGQGNAVQPATDLGHRDGVALGQREVGLRRLRAIEEEARRVTRLHVGRVACTVGEPEGTEGDHLLAVDGETFTARGQHAHLRARFDDRLGQVAGRVEEVFAIVEDEQQTLRSQVFDQAPGEVHPGSGRRSEGRGDDLHERLRIACRRELAEPRTVRVLREDLGRELDGQARLPDAAHARERDQRRGPKCVRDLVEFLGATHERRLASRQVAGKRIEREQRGKSRRETGRAHLEHVLRVGEVAAGGVRRGRRTRSPRHARARS